MSPPSPVCVNCGRMRGEHHREGWCFWLSDTDHLPVMFSLDEVTILQIVDDDGHPLHPEDPQDA